MLNEVSVQESLSSLKETAYIDPKLKEMQNSPDSDDIVLVWIDVEAQVDKFNDLYLPKIRLSTELIGYLVTVKALLLA